MPAVFMVPFLRKRAHAMAYNTEVRAGSDTDPRNELYATDDPTGIRLVANPSDAVVDIVLIHGLMGNRETTWTHRNGVFWPNTLLAQDFPRARIMTYGYDSDVVRFWTMVSSNRLNDHGKLLAYALLDQREEAGQRPIIFIAHSLGGLVCEEALNFSNKRRSLASTLPSTSGIIFMGTPHGGSPLAGWGRTAAKYVNFLRGTNQDILKELRFDSSDLQNIEEDFQHMLKDNDKLKVHCFYEALKMNDAFGKIVEKESAILPAYDNCSIDADHRNMTKFTGRADAGYGQVRGVLERWMKDLESRPLDVSGSGTATMVDESGRVTHRYNGPVFYGAMSGRYVIPGPHTTGGTTNFHFPK